MFSFGKINAHLTYTVVYIVLWNAALCRDCLHDHIMASREADVKCPCNINDEVTCKGSITEAEMRSVCPCIMDISD